MYLCLCLCECVCWKARYGGCVCICVCCVYVSVFVRKSRNDRVPGQNKHERKHLFTEVRRHPGPWDDFVIHGHCTDCAKIEPRFACVCVCVPTVLVLRARK